MSDVVTGQQTAGPDNRRWVGNDGSHICGLYAMSQALH